MVGLFPFKVYVKSAFEPLPALQVWPDVFGWVTMLQEFDPMRGFWKNMITCPNPLTSYVTEPASFPGTGFPLVDHWISVPDGVGWETHCPWKSDLPIRVKEHGSVPQVPLATALIDASAFPGIVGTKNIIPTTSMAANTVG